MSLLSTWGAIHHSWLTMCQHQVHHHHLQLESSLKLRLEAVVVDIELMCETWFCQQVQTALQRETWISSSGCQNDWQSHSITRRWLLKVDTYVTLDKCRVWTVMEKVGSIGGAGVTLWHQEWLVLMMFCCSCRPKWCQDCARIFICSRCFHAHLCGSRKTEGESNLPNNKVESLLNQTLFKYVTVRATFAMWGSYSQTVALGGGDLLKPFRWNKHQHMHFKCICQ